MGVNTHTKSGNGKVVLGVGIIRVAIRDPLVIIVGITVIAHILGSCSSACP
jgi:hypothetical protein